MVLVTCKWLPYSLIPRYQANGLITYFDRKDSGNTPLHSCHRQFPDIQCGIGTVPFFYHSRHHLPLLNQGTGKLNAQILQRKTLRVLTALNSTLHIYWKTYSGTWTAFGSRTVELTLTRWAKKSWSAAIFIYKREKNTAELLQCTSVAKKTPTWNKTELGKCVALSRLWQSFVQEHSESIFKGTAQWFPCAGAKPW